jgi:hypothetical protein
LTCRWLQGGESLSEPRTLTFGPAVVAYRVFLDPTNLLAKLIFYLRRDPANVLSRTGPAEAPPRQTVSQFP